MKKMKMDMGLNKWKNFRIGKGMVVEEEMVRKCVSKAGKDSWV